MIHKCTIAGEEVQVAWNNETARRFGFRAALGNVNVKTLHRDFANPAKSGAAFVSFLWLILPPAKSREFASPEELYMTITAGDAESVYSAVQAVLLEMVPDAEKKSTSKNSRLQKSNSGSRKKNSTSNTRR